MNRHPLKIHAAALLIAASCVANAADAAVAQPILLDAVVVTPKGLYSAAEWQARQAGRQLAVAAPVLLEPVIVTPSRRYTIAEWHARGAQRQYAATELRKARHWLRAVWRTLSLKSQPQEA